MKHKSINILKLTNFSGETIQQGKRLDLQDKPEIPRESRKLTNFPDICFIRFTGKNKNFQLIKILSGNKDLYVKYEPLEVVKNIKGNNFHLQRVVKVAEHVYRGSRPINEEAIKALKKEGIDTIVCFLKKAEILKVKNELK